MTRANALLSVMLLGVGCAQENQITDHTDGDGVYQHLVFDPEFLGFGLGVVGEPRSLTTELHNLGETVVAVDALAVEGSPAFTVEPMGGSIAFAPGESREVTVTFTGQDLSEVATLHAIVDGQAIDSFVELTGESRFPSLTVSAAELGRTIEGCASTSAEVEIRAGEHAPVEVTQVSLVSSGPVALGSLPALPWTMAPGEVRRVQLTLPTEVITVVDGDIAVISNALGSPTTAPVTGEVAPPDLEYAVEVFTQNQEDATPKVDLLLVVDRSCSMEDDLIAIEANLPRFVDTLRAIDADLRLGAVVRNDGCLSYGPEAVDLVDASLLAEMVRRSSDAFTEEGVGMTARAVVDRVGGCNQGAFQPGAGLQAVWISDEVEQSRRGTAYELERLRVVRPEFVGHGVINFAESMGYATSVALTGGALVELTEADWSSVFDALSAAVSDSADPLLSAWPLSRSPDTVTVTVTVNGVPMLGGWSLASDVLRFDAPPPPGAIIEVRYAEYSTCD